MLRAPTDAAENPDDEELLEAPHEAREHVQNREEQAPQPDEDAAREPAAEDADEHLGEAAGEGRSGPQEPQLDVAQVEVLHDLRVEHRQSPADEVVQRVKHDDHRQEEGRPNGHPLLHG